ncbi:MAG: hypothetical protein QNJ46_32600 [Leptolyngbyaceae cyanobacterium MO_188.B28]|nr:hypothetical protein [Leptolyngbyaceae cyanobacterium MO_188.B28]
MKLEGWVDGWMGGWVDGEELVIDQVECRIKVLSDNSVRDG